MLTTKIWNATVGRRSTSDDLALRTDSQTSLVSVKVRCPAVSQKDIFPRIRAVYNRFDGQVDSNRKPTGFDSAVVTSSGQFTLHSIQLLDHERKLREILNKMFFLLSCLHHCAFTANPIVITVNNFASTFDNADRPQFINGLSPE